MLPANLFNHRSACRRPSNRVGLRRLSSLQSHEPLSENRRSALVWSALR